MHWIGDTVRWIQLWSLRHDDRKHDRYLLTLASFLSQSFSLLILPFFLSLSLRSFVTSFPLSLSVSTIVLVFMLSNTCFSHLICSIHLKSLFLIKAICCYLEISWQLLLTLHSANKYLTFTIILPSRELSNWRGNVLQSVEKAQQMILIPLIKSSSMVLSSILNFYIL